MSGEMRTDTAAILGLADQLGSASESIDALSLRDAVAAAVGSLPSAETGAALREAAEAIDSVLATVPRQLQALAGLAVTTAARYDETENRSTAGLTSMGGV